MLKACSKCGKIHDDSFQCTKRIYPSDKERKLRSQYSWTKKSLQIREEAHNLCEVCRAQGRYTYDNIEVHHIVKLRDNADGLLEDDNLIALCQEHHKMADKGELSVEYLKKIVAERYPPTL